MKTLLGKHSFGIEADGHDCCFTLTHCNGESYDHPLPILCFSILAREVMCCLVSVTGATEGHLPGRSSSSDQSESSSGENHVVDGGSQDLSHSEQDDSSEKMGLISEGASPPGSPEQPPPDLASAISNWVQFEDDTPWTSTSPPPPKETGGTGGRPGRDPAQVCAPRGCFSLRV